MSWFKRTAKGIQTSTKERRDIPRKLWFKLSSGSIVEQDKLVINFYASPDDDYRVHINSKGYLQVLFGNNELKELDVNMVSKDPLSLVDTKSYSKRLEEATNRTELEDAVRIVVGSPKGVSTVISCTDFASTGGSMGSAVGEKICRAIDYAIERKFPFLMISKSGGACMMKTALSLIQMARTSIRLARPDEARLPYVSLCTDPTTEGISASFAMLSDTGIAELSMLIGFAGPRIVRDTTEQGPPKGPQTAEFVPKYGFLDSIVSRKRLEGTVNLYTGLVMNREIR